MNIGLALQQLFPNADPLNDYLVQDDGAGAYIAMWNLPDPQPTEAELLAAWQQWVVDNTAEQQVVESEKTDLSDLLPQIAGELSYITTTLAAIDTMTHTQLLAVVKRILLEQRTELKAWRYVIRRLTT